ncbi:NO-inducible flavohemoprotein [Bacillus mangrovi]|uniref:Flavohemoprotein n=1 Tax=Metabacillus mangrovi TaxID=1491830 RepID=A0A7X2S8V3_9BACI|nr:NO-inducible flavohemoprotein [Metabacillus mangrovi]MTH55749.1 NO-inducible flavohemoprotein [Metabacillus mangrovi]
MLSEKTVSLIQSTVPVLARHGETITTVFYQNLFRDHPELLNLFNQSNQKEGRQQKALAQTLIAAAANIRQLDALLPAVRQIAHKHRSLGVQKEHYPIVGEYLLKAMREVLGSGANEEVLAAWQEAYGVIADVFIQEEAALYEQAEGGVGGWKGFIPLRIANKVKESSEITSFYLTPALPNENLPAFQPGQYITIKVKPAGEAIWHHRQYSLSNAPGSSQLRISVKREEHGVVSAHLHRDLNIGDCIEASAPAGEFVLDEKSDAPVTFISGGVGVTPLVGMLNSLAGSQRQIHWIHSARSEEVHAFREETDSLIDQLPNGSIDVFYGNTQGRITDSMLKQILKTDKGDYYLCGPVPFMAAMIRALEILGIPEDRIHHEFFGPAVPVEAGEAV